jgi:hypothetical protein
MAAAGAKLVVQQTNTAKPPAWAAAAANAGNASPHGPSQGCSFPLRTSQPQSRPPAGLTLKLVSTMMYAALSTLAPLLPAAAAAAALLLLLLLEPPHREAASGVTQK